MPIVPQKYKNIKMRFFAFLLLFMMLNIIKAQQAFNIIKLDNFNNPNLPKVDGTDIWNDITGWYNPADGNEYAIAGSTDSIYFFKITTDDKLKQVDVKFGLSRFARNRDYETYKNYLYTVSDQASGLGALQIFNLSTLPDSATTVYSSREFLVFSHTIFIDSVTARLYVCGNSGSGAPATLRVLSIQNPEKPTLLGDIQVPSVGGIPLFNYVHEMFARNDTVYLSTGNTGLFMFDLKDINNQKYIGAITQYPDQGYNHSSWLSQTGNYIMFTDENIGLDVKIFNISNPAEPKFVSRFNSSENAMPHNAFWFGDYVYVSAYHDGVQIWYAKNPDEMIRVAWFDTHPVEPEVYSGFKGCWGVYPFLPSKRIIASDLTSGIWLLRADLKVSTPKKLGSNNYFVLYPVPANNNLYYNYTNAENVQEIFIKDISGNTVKTIQNISTQSINVTDLKAGVYIVFVTTNDGTFTQKIIKY